MPPFHIEYFCPREAPYWQTYKQGLIFKTVAQFPIFETAQARCDRMLWAYHSARVVDAAGNVVYQV